MSFEYSLSFPKFVLFGDSITQRAFSPYPLQDVIDDGYTTLEEDPPVADFNLGLQLQRDYVRRMDVLNRGFTGYNSAQYRLMIDKILAIEHDLSYSKIEVATLFLGTNDAAHAPPDGVPYDTFIENMTFIVEQILKRGIKLIIIGPAHHYSDLWNSLNPSDVANGILRDNDTNRKYSDGLRKLATEFQLPFIDLSSIFDHYNKSHNDPEATKRLFFDGIHLNGQGYKIIYDCITQAIETHYPSYSPKNMPTRLPKWVEFDAEKVKGIVIEK
ncbi:DEKNAAC104471 [Brettanomyces naardenensis]|uniref:DEKNAAC104471 n=1 Tax=Brettanomyces naardenensis TaxID=13370 RepID=A0A448YRR3_BRENA|nr:DEKNAAC104471 [Brettanomyces naardenensis]